MAFDLEGLRLLDLEPGEEEALRAYKAAADDANGQSRCFELNQQLRSGLYLEEIAPTLAATARHMDAVFDRCPVLPEALTVYRGTGTRAFLQKLAPGYRFRAAEFWSTSHVEASVEKFIGLGGAVLELELPVGMPVYNMETIEGAGGSENEFLLPRGVLWEFLSASSMVGNEVPPLLRDKIRGPHDAIARVRLRVVFRTRPR